jgi:high-affinity iron transporter
MLGTLIIVFREVIEAGLIVGIVLAATRGVPGRGWRVALGVAGGVVGAGVVALFAGAISSLFSGSGQEYFNAAVLAVAVGMLTWHNVWMASHGREMARDMRQVGADVAGGERSLWALSIVVGVAVLREGSELVLFLYGIAASGGAGAGAMLTGGALGLCAGALVSALTYFGLVSIPSHRLFAVTSGLITLLAAGLAAQAVAFLQQAGWLQQMATPLWDTSGVLAQDSLGGRLLHTLIGYTDQPNAAQLIAYALTVALIVTLMRRQSASAGR